ncbi:PD40 domain-containing protein [Candidatus Sumerlaeota bacterium]|nr:PD40 domain-containing protein [Candidatus Sumerlaeota bacterium]
MKTIKKRDGRRGGRPRRSAGPAGRRLGEGWPLGICLLIAAIGWISPGDGAAADGETLVHSRHQPDNWDLYLFDEPGASPRRLTTHPGLDYNPVFSPDGRWIVFTSERNGNPDLYALDLENPGPPRQITRSAAMEDAAAFSPDGRLLAFVSTRTGNADIFVMPFSPESPEPPGPSIRPKNLTNHRGGDFNPAFSPDGKRIIFSSNRDSSNSGWDDPEEMQYGASDIYIMKSDGETVLRLIRHREWDGSPAWSASGRVIYFYSRRDGQPRIYRRSVSASDLEEIDTGTEAALSPTLTPEGRLAFSGRRSGKWSILSTTSDGGDVRLESDTERDYWAPDYDASSGRMVCYGQGPIELPTRFETDAPGPFLVSGPRRIRLPGRDDTFSIYAVRGYLPSFNAATLEVASGEAFSRIVVSKLDGSATRKVFDRANAMIRYRGENSAWAPSWSPDGGWIVCSVGPPDGETSADVDIWKFKSDGSEAVNLTPDSDANDALPSFSPDGRSIVFRSNRDGNEEIYLMDSAGSGTVRLTRNVDSDTMASFSSGGAMIAFSSNRGGEYDIYILELTKSGTAGDLRRVTRTPGRDLYPRFSPDDRWLVYTSERGGMNDERPLVRSYVPQPHVEIYALNLQDGRTVRLTHNKWDDGPASWSAAVPAP